MHHVLGIDIGGTFTDIVLFDRETRAVHAHKELTTPHDPNEAVARGFAILCGRCGIEPADVARVVHATTLFTNALVERRGARVGLLTTEGFADVVRIGRERKYELYDLTLTLPSPLCADEDRLELPERLDASGAVVTPLDAAAAVAVARQAVAQGCESLAISFINAYVSGAHEAAAAEAIAAALPGVPLSLSHRVANEIREYDRTTTTIANAYIRPLADRYLTRFEAGLRALGVAAPVFVMLSNGGLTSIAEAMRVPIQLLECGPAAGALAASFFAQQAGIVNLMALDLGGTTAKLCTVEGGQPVVVHRFEAAREKRFVPESGLPIRIPTVDLIEIGAGGGSIAQRDQLGLLKVGPRSAGAMPGPASYGRGGTEPTLTDANLQLGYLDPAYFAGGDIALDVGAGEAALGRLALALDMAPAATAAGIHDLANENMAAAARVHAAERGTDPQRLALVVTGGGGPIHGGSVARKLGIRTMLCPPAAGVASAIGLTLAPARIDRQRFVGAKLDREGEPVLRPGFLALAEEIRAAAGEIGLGGLPLRLSWRADMRYAGQGFEVEVALPEELPPDEAATCAALLASFEVEYRKIFTRLIAWAGIEVVSLRATGTIALEDSTHPLASGHAPTESQATRERSIRYGADATAMVAKQLRWESLAVGDELTGPALVQQPGSTLVLGPGDTLRLDAQGLGIVTLAAPAATASATGFDNVRAGLLWQRLIGIVDEASAGLVRSSFSTVVRESDDFSVVLTDQHGRLLAQGTKSIPVFIGSLPRTVRHFLDRFPPDALHPGDVLITNDPWHGTGHLFDISVAMPLFRDGRLIAFAASTAHATDIGGRSGAQKIPDIFEEGLQIPTRKLIRRGEIDDTLMDVIRQNVRAPEQVLGDLLGQVAALDIVARRLATVMEEWGLGDLDAFAEDSFTRTDRAMRAAIATMKPGTFSADQSTDGMDDPLLLKAAVTVADGEVTVDYAGSSAQIPAALNVAYCYTHAFTVYALKCLLDSESPNNEGSHRALHVVAPQGSIVNHSPPYSGGNRALVGHYLPGLVLAALAPMMPDKVMAGVGSPMWSFLLRGRDGAGRPFALKTFFNGGMGALAHRDGLHATSWPSNISGAPIETIEQTAPIRVLTRRLRKGSGGAGRFRGGDGLEIEIVFLEGGPFTIGFNAERTKSPAKGLFGGGDGAVGEILLNGTPIDIRELLSPRSGDRLTIRTPGGGGYGAPAR